MARVPRVFADSSESKGGMGAEGSLAAHLRVLVCMKVGGFVPYHPYIPHPSIPYLQRLSHCGFEIVRPYVRCGPVGQLQ